MKCPNKPSVELSVLAEIEIIYRSSRHEQSSLTINRLTATFHSLCRILRISQMSCSEPALSRLKALRAEPHHESVDSFGFSMESELDATISDLSGYDRPISSSGNHYIAT